jgi:hypothetical protein
MLWVFVCNGVFTKATLAFLWQGLALKGLIKLESDKSFGPPDINLTDSLNKGTWRALSVQRLNYSME